MSDEITNLIKRINREQSWFTHQIMRIELSVASYSLKYVQMQNINLFKFQWAERLNFLCKHVSLKTKLLHPFQHGKLLERKESAIFDVFRYCTSSVNMMRVLVKQEESEEMDKYRQLYEFL